MKKSRLSQFRKSIKDSENFLLIPELNKAVVKANKPRKLQYFHPSGLQDCDVKLVGKILFPKEFKTVFDARTLRILSNGRKVHERIEEGLDNLPDGIIHKVNGKKCIEYPLTHLKYFLKGTCDAIVNLDGKLYILEIKGLKDTGYERAKMERDVGAGYKLQSVAYIAMARHQKINVQGTLFLIECKNDQNQFEFILPFDEDLWERTRKRLLKLKLSVKKKKLPPRSYPRDSWQCQNCDSYKFCWKK